MSLNPYQVLGVTLNATKSDIIKAVHQAMRVRNYSPKDIGEAQKLLLDTNKRILVDLMLFRLPSIRRLKPLFFTNEELYPILPELEDNASFDMAERLSSFLENNIENLEI